jgi:hypothetical protein
MRNKKEAVQSVNRINRELEFEVQGPRERCEICKEGAGAVYAVISRDAFTCKARVCFRCFGELEECGGPWVEPVSLQEFKETVERPGHCGL